MYEDKYIKKEDGYYLQGFKPGNFLEGTDDWALSQNKISITPLGLDATNYKEIKNTISQELNQ
jgi:broad specificity polyphosphatase/5'/3'-nucleotidase SurE